MGIFPAERDHWWDLGVCTMEDGMLLILDSIIYLTAVKPRGRPVIPSGCLIAKSLYTESKLSYAINDITGQIKEHVIGKSVRRPHHQGPGCRWCAPLSVGQCFTIALSLTNHGMQP